MTEQIASAEAEREFVTFLHGWYVAQGISADDRLCDHYVRSEADATFREGQRIVREIDAEFDTSVSGLRILDVGCGFCGASAALVRAGANVIGIDASSSQLNVGRTRLRLHEHVSRLIQATGTALPFRTSQFDLVICTSVLEHVPPTVRPGLIQEIVRVLKPGGILYLAFPNLAGIQNVVRDPHYQLCGVTLLPKRMADAYVRWRLRRSYDAEVFPISYRIASVARRHGISLFNLAKSERVLLERLANPSRITRLVPRIICKSIALLRLKKPAEFVVSVWASVGSNAVLVGRKNGLCTS